MGRFELLFILTVYCLFPSIEGIFLPDFFRGWMLSGETSLSCDGVCQLSMTCWIAGGRVSTDGDCHSMFKVRPFKFKLKSTKFNKLFQRFVSSNSSECFLEQKIYSKEHQILKRLQFSYK
jgi:hypothetical protein